MAMDYLEKAKRDYDKLVKNKYGSGASTKSDPLKRAKEDYANVRLQAIAEELANKEREEAIREYLKTAEPLPKRTPSFGNAGVVPGGNITRETSENPKAYKGRTEFVEGYGGGRMYSQDYASKYKDASDEEKLSAANHIQDVLARRSRTSMNDDPAALALQRLMSRNKTQHDLEDELNYLTAQSSEDLQAGMREHAYTTQQSRVAAIDALLNDKDSNLSNEIKRKLKEERGNLEAQNTQYERFYQAADDARDLRNNADYMLYSRKRPDIGAPAQEDIDAYNASIAIGETPKSIDVNDKLGFYLGTSESERTAASERVETGYAGVVEHVLQQGYKGAWDELKEDEIGNYYYLYNTQGKAAAEQYLKDMEVILSKRRYDKEMQNIAGAENWELALSSIASIPGNIVGGAFAFADDVIRGISGQERNPYSTAHILQNRAQGIREATSDRINEGKGDFLGMTWGDVYQSSMSMGESLLGSVMGGGGDVYSVLMGMGAASSTAKDLYEQGASEAEIASVSMLAGAAEFVFEKIGMEKLLESGKSAKGVRDIILDILKQGGVEGMEEGATEIANILTDAVIRGRQSNFSQNVQARMAQGESRAAATAKAVVLDAGGDVLKAAAMGALAGAGSASIYSSVNGAQNIKAIRQEGADILAEGGQKVLLDAAYEMAKESVSKDAQSLGKKADRVKKILESDRASAGRKAQAVGRLSAEINESIAPEQQARIKKDLMRKGIGEKEATRLAKDFMAEKESGELSRRTKSAIAESRGVQGYYKNVVSNKDSHINALDRRIAASKAGVVLNDDGSVNEEETRKNVAKTMAVESDIDLETNDKEHDMLRIGNNMEEIEISEIESIADDGKKVQMKLKLSDGRVVDAKDISFGSEDDALLYEGLAAAGITAEAANVLVREYHADPSADVGAFVIGAMDAYTYGRYGYGTDKLASLSMPETQSKLAYELGREFSTTEAAKSDAAVQEKVAAAPAKEKKVGTIDKTVTKGMSDAKKANVELLTGLSKMLGIDVYTYESKMRNGKRQYQDESGKWVAAPNGYFDPNDNSIHIDLNAGYRGEGLVMYTFAHELTHFIKKWSPAKFKVLADFLVEKYVEKGADVDALVKAQLRKAWRSGRTHFKYDDAFEEFVADSMETMLTDTNAIERLAELKQRDETLWNKIKEFFTKFLENIKKMLKLYEGKAANSYEGAFVREQLSEFVDQIGKLFAEGVYEASERYQNSTVVYDANSQSVAPKRSERTWTASEYVQMREETIKALVKDLGVNERVAAAYIDDINSIAALIADDRVRLDYEPNVDESATVLKANSEYKYTVDMSTLCSKRLLFTGTFDAIQREMPNRAFTSEEIVELREMMVQKGLEVACGICYVESTRREIGAITQEFIERYKAAQKSGKPISRINSKGAEVELKGKGKTFLAEKGYTPTLADLNTTDIDLVKRDHREVYDAYLVFMNARGQAKPKLLETRAEYKGEVLKRFKSKSTVKARNDAGGLRLQSFSDFEVPHMIDMMQVVMDMSRVGLKSQAYTKVPAFAEVFGDTGVKINLSLIAKGNGLDANGQLIFDDVEGINHEEAFRLREKFSKNVGTILVGKNYAHIIAAMADPRIDYIIPFHKSSWKESLYDALGLTGYDDYASTQNEKYIDKSRGVAENFAPSEYWDYSKTGDENAQIYLEKCRQDGRIPKFPQFQGYPGYWKLLIDFKMYDNDGVGSPQEVVRPQFEMDAAKRILNEYKGGHRTLPVAKDVVSEFVEKYKADERKYSAREDIRYSVREVNGHSVVWTDENILKQNQGLPVHQFIANYIAEHIGEVYTIIESGQKVYIGEELPGEYTQSVYTRKVLKHNPNIAKAKKRVVANLGEMIEIAGNRRWEKTRHPHSKDAKYGMYRYDTRFGFPVLDVKGNAVGANIYNAELIIRNASDGRKYLYDLVSIKKDTVTSEWLSAKMTSATEKSVGQKDNAFNQSMPQSNNGVKASEENKNQLRPDSDFSNRSVLVNALESTAKTAEERERLRDYKAKIVKLEETEARLAKVRNNIKEYYFTKGGKKKFDIEQLEKTRKSLESSINYYDRKLLQLESTSVLKDLMKREREALARKYRAEAKEAVVEERAAREKKLSEYKAHIKTVRENERERREKAAMRGKIKRVVNALNQLLLHGTKEKNVKVGMQKVVAEALDAINMDTVSAEARIAAHRAEIDKGVSEKRRTELEEKIANIRKMGEGMQAKLEAFRTAYDKFKNSDDPDVANGYDEVISERIAAVAEEVGNTPLRDMTMEQLEEVYDLYKMVLTRVRDANKMFIAGKKATIEGMGTDVMNEVVAAGGSKDVDLEVARRIKKFAWNNLKPIYAMRRIGSSTLTDVYRNVRKGEDTWAVDVAEAKEFYEKVSTKYGYKKWNFDKLYKFVSNTGVEFELTLDQILSLYAYSKREQADLHLEKGGFVFNKAIKRYRTKKGKDGETLKRSIVKYTVNTANTHRLSAETLRGITDNLTAEQKAFADEMQAYLSDVMGAKGNEVSMAMYGVKLFKEKFYFPLKTANQFLFEKNAAAGELKIKNSGMTKETVKNATSPIILNNFMDVWAGHINDMAMYHAFVLPLEDLNRVFNYKTRATDEADTESVKQKLENAYGEAATEYISQLIKDLNGGVRSDPTESTAKKFTSRFKKAAVSLSLSVAIQQPSATARALAVIDPKYFFYRKMNVRKMWDTEIKKYAPVAIIKDMGRFDTDMGQSTVDYIKGATTNWEKFKEGTDNVISWLPGKLDQVTWCHIWNAVKRETLAKRHAKGEKNVNIRSAEFLTEAGKRFTEVIELTQVYDSVFARSANMRSKSGLMNMLTSFMAEPTTSINMMNDAVLEATRGNGKAAVKTAGAVLASIILNSTLVAVVRALRDRDEEETFLEKYASAFMGEVIDGFNPLTYIPIVKDIWSILQGYSVERSDMSIVQDIYDTAKNLVKYWQTDTSEMDGEQLAAHAEKGWDAYLGFAGTVSNAVGLPLKNLITDVRGIIDKLSPADEHVKNNATSFWQSVAEGAKDAAIPEIVRPKDEPESDKLYDAIVSGDTAYYNRIAGQYKDDKAVHSAIRTSLRENDERIRKAAVARYNGDPATYMRLAREIMADGFLQDDVVKAINSEMSSLDKDIETETSSKKTGMFATKDFMNAILDNDQATAEVAKRDMIETAVANGKEESAAVKSFEGSVRTACRTAFLDGEANSDDVYKILTEYGGLDDEEAREKVTEWEFENQYGFAYSDRADAYKNRQITSSELKTALVDVGGKTSEEADAQIEVYDWQKDGIDLENGETFIITRYNEYCESAGVDRQTYVDFYRFYLDAGVEGEAYSKTKECMPYIDSLPIGSAQKDAIARSIWAESTVRRYKTW